MKRFGLPFACVVLTLASGCKPHRDATPTALPPSLASLPNGDVAGGPQSNIGALIRDPLEGQPDAIETGRMLFVQMNCAGCHGYDLGGAMGPNLTDHYWRYGGTPAAIYRSIAQGHPQGMPAWDKALPPIAIWQLTAYIQSKGGAVAPENYQAALQGDMPSRTPAPSAGGAPGAQTGAKGSTSPAAQPPNP